MSVNSGRETSAPCNRTANVPNLSRTPPARQRLPPFHARQSQCHRMPDGSRSRSTSSRASRLSQPADCVMSASRQPRLPRSHNPTASAGLLTNRCQRLRPASPRPRHTQSMPVGRPREPHFSARRALRARKAAVAREYSRSAGLAGSRIRWVARTRRDEVPDVACWRGLHRAHQKRAASCPQPAIAAMASDRERAPAGEGMRSTVHRVQQRELITP